MPLTYNPSKRQRNLLTQKQKCKNFISNFEIHNRQFHEFLNEFYQFGFCSNRVGLCTTRVIFEANEGIYSIKFGYCISLNTETKLLKLR